VSPVSLYDDVVPLTPAPAPANASSDPVLEKIVKANEAGLRKRRLLQGVHPDLQVLEPPTKHRLVAAKVNISRLLELVF
jgi:hypothetical protein